MRDDDGGRRSEGPRFTEEQARSLAVREASVALSAGAGCGKTTVLAGRYLRALEDEPGLIHSMVAVTFTEKAARELRERIRDACHARARRGQGADDAWRAVLRSLEAAPICTFHQYCAGLLRRHAVAARIDPDFQVLDAAISSTIREEAVHRFLLARIAGLDDDLLHLAVEYGLQRVRDEATRLVAHREADRLADWADRSGDDIMECWRQAADRKLRPIRRRDLLAAARDCGAFWERLDVADAKLSAKRAQILEDLSELPRRLDDLGWLDELSGRAKMPTGVRVAQWPSVESNERAKSLLAALREAVGDLRDALAVDEDATRRGAEMGRRVARLLGRARIAYQAAKHERGALDFDDLLVKTRDLLREDPSVREAERRRLRLVLVDEFQDTDPVQGEIIALLAGDEFSRGRLFVVGDFKQSIYRFRGARPRLFHDYRDAFPPEGRLGLTENFRSVPGVIDFVNALFLGAFEGETGGLRVGDRLAATPAPPAVEFVWPSPDRAPGGEADGGPRKKKLGADEEREIESRWLARLIRSRIAGGWPIRDRRTGAPRPAHPGDVAILFRSMTNLAPYEQALADEGLDYHVIGGSSFYAQEEVRDLINVLSVVEDPFDGIALAGALRSPFFGLSDDALFWLGSSERGELADRFLADEARDVLSASDRLRADRARRLLDGWRSMKDRLSIGDLVDRVLDESGYEAALLGEWLGDRKRANARKLVRLARDFDARGGFTLAHFVARLRADLQDPPKEEQAATTDEQGKSVRLLSIHQSKGLEFPIVVVPDLNRVGPSRFSLVEFDPELGPVVGPSGDAEESVGVATSAKPSKSQGRLIFEAVERREEEEELLRLFYVATTRARDALILSAAGGADCTPHSPAMKRLEACFDRATGACRVALPEGWPVPQVRVLAACPPESPTRPGRRGAGAISLAGIIHAADNATAPTQRERRFRPQRLDLDGLGRWTERERRLRRLLRTTLADPDALRPGGLEAAALRAARRQSPRLNASTATELVRLLDGPLAQLLRHAGRVEPGPAWSIEWPPGSSDPTEVFGGSDLVVADEQGRRGVAVVSFPGHDGPIERLRWMLAARWDARRRSSPVQPGWRILLGEPWRFIGEDPPEDGEIDATFEAVLREIEG